MKKLFSILLVIAPVAIFLTSCADRYDDITPCNSCDGHTYNNTHNNTFTPPPTDSTTVTPPVCGDDYAGLFPPDGNGYITDAIVTGVTGDSPNNYWVSFKFVRLVVINGTPSTLWNIPLAQYCDQIQLVDFTSPKTQNAFCCDEEIIKNYKHMLNNQTNGAVKVLLTISYDTQSGIYRAGQQASYAMF